MKQLVELPVVLIEHQHMPVALRLRPAFDVGIRRNGIRPRIALIRVFKSDGHLRLIAAHDVIRNPSRLPLPHHAKVLMQPRLRADGRNDRIAQRIDLVLRHIAVPFIIGWHEQSTAEIGIRPGFELWLLSKRSAGDEKGKDGFHGCLLQTMRITADHSAIG